MHSLLLHIPILEDQGDHGLGVNLIDSRGYELEDGSGARIFKQAITSDANGGLSIFEVSTDPELPLDLEQVMIWSANQLDDKDLKEAFIASQL